MRNIRVISKVSGKIAVPGSKSYTQRALVVASLASGRSVLHNPLISEDTTYLIEALRAIGANIFPQNDTLCVEGTGGRINQSSKVLYMGNNGTGLRFLTSIVCLGRGRFVIDGNERMRQRPIQPLVEALKQMGVRVWCTNDDGCPPLEIDAYGLPGGRITLNTSFSSQYLSSVLLASPYAEKDTEIEIISRTPSIPYVDMTLEVMRDFGASVLRSKDSVYHVTAQTGYTAREYAIEGDVSSATYFMAAAGILGGSITISNIKPHTSQADIMFLDILRILGAKIESSNAGISITGPIVREGDYSFNLNRAPDLVPALAVLSAFRVGKTVIKEIGQLRYKECDRISALCAELNKIGAKAIEGQDEIVVQGMATRGAEIECYGDHRIAMSFAIAGLALDGIVIKDEVCVNKSFPNFWEVLEIL
nr:3-phosphoshikimate 1-carboxyvinyltransferase [Desulfobacterales bacterium]